MSLHCRLHPTPPLFRRLAFRLDLRLVCSLVCSLACVMAGLLLAPAQGWSATARHGLAIGGEPKYPADFPHFDYVNPQAPVGGTLRLNDIDTFDTFNPFLAKGLPAPGVGAIYDTLCIKSEDEPFTMYGQLASGIELADDRLSVTFHLRPEAKFHDGHPLAADDVVFTFQTLTTKASPSYKRYYQDVTGCEALDERRVKFTLGTAENRELPLIIGEMPILPKHFWEGRDFAAANLDIPLGSGPYRVERFEAGRSVTYVRVADYWGAQLPANKGRNNFERIRYDSYKDATVALEAFKAGEYDYRAENVARQWATGYGGKALEEKLILKEEIPHAMTAGMQGFVFNTRREVFQDPRVRQALAYAFDFEWSNENLFHGQYVRTKSWFAGGELASRGLPSPEELRLLEPWRGRIPEEVFTKTYEPPSTAAPQSLRGNLKIATDLLAAAGWKLENNVLKKNGKALEFEYLEKDPAFERIILPFLKNLERLGVRATPRMVDMTQYVNRLRDYDFDMTSIVVAQSESPGNEQRSFFHSKAADTPDLANYAGIKDPAVDALVEAIVAAPDRAALVTACRALDRVLLWGHYVVPQWHLNYWRVAHWDKFSRPATQPAYSIGVMNWWVDPARRDRVLKARPDLERKGF